MSKECGCTVYSALAAERDASEALSLAVSEAERLEDEVRYADGVTDEAERVAAANAAFAREQIARERLTVAMRARVRAFTT